MIGVPPMGYNSSVILNVTISHVAVTLCGSAYADYNQSGIYSIPASVTNLTLSYCYFSNASSNMLFRNWYDSTISYNYFHDNFTGLGTQPHGQQISGAGHNITIRNNIFQDSMVYVTGTHDTADKSIGWKIYNNIILRGQFTAVWGSADTGASLHPDVIQGWEIYNNTYVDSVMSSWGVICIDNLSDPAMKSYLYNNLFYNITGAAGPNINAVYAVHDYNAFINCNTGTTPTETHIQVGSGNPFVNSAGGNFRIVAHTMPGLSLGAPFDKDFTDSQRNTYDRGAFEYIKIPSKITTLNFAP